MPAAEEFHALARRPKPARFAPEALAAEAGRPA